MARGERFSDAARMTRRRAGAGPARRRSRLLRAISTILLAAALLAPSAVRANVLVRPAAEDAQTALRHSRVGIATRGPARTAILSPARIRVAMLYRAGEFSTFWRQSPPVAGRDFETVERTLPLDRQVEDAWIAMDKVKHVAFSFLWTLGTQYTAVNKGGLSEHRALPISITSSALTGVTKEYYDLHVGPTRYFSARDLVADALGIVLAVGLILL